MNAWRLDCSTTPWRASISTSATSAVDGAGDHVARVADVARRVGEDERAPRGGEEAVGDVDRDALLALGAQAVGEQREVEPPSPRSRLVELDGVELVVEDRASCRAAGGRSACSCRRRPIPRSRRAGARAARSSGSSSEVALALAVLHRGHGHAVVGARLAALGHARGGDLARRPPRASRPRSARRR